MAPSARSAKRHDNKELAERYRATRDLSVALTRTLEPEDFVVQSMADASPTKWHLAHTSWFFENFLLQEKLSGYRVFDERYGFIFNSYYFQVGQMHRRAERGLLTRPTVREVLDYRSYVDEQMLRLIEDHGHDPNATSLVLLGINHEQQHQELLLTDIKHAFSRNPMLPVFRDLPTRHLNATAELHFIPGADGIHPAGSRNNEFSYDNEGPVHNVLLHPHAIANRLVTNGEFRAFIDDGGYERAELWLSDGWLIVRQQQWCAPFYWQQDLDSEFTLGGVREINPHAPVSHVSFYEADAFARWAGGRLPTEFEWETWATGVDTSGNFVDSGFLHPVPVNDNKGKLQVFGDVWEWTASPYTAYPGFQPSEGAIGEYNGKFMCNQMVLRGGSCATHSTHIRHSYRNFFYPADRWQFSGIRLAKDLT